MEDGKGAYMVKRPYAVKKCVFPDIDPTAMCNAKTNIGRRSYVTSLT